MIGEEQTRAQLLDEINTVMNHLSRIKDTFYARRLESVGLTLLQFTGLQAIDQLGPGVSVGEIGEAIGAPPSTMTSLTNRLVALSLIDRYTPPDNRRAVLVKSTEAGASLVRDFICEREKDTEAIFEAMTDDQLAFLVTFLHDVVANSARLLEERLAAEIR